MCNRTQRLAELVETNVLSIVPEALAAHHQVVLFDECMTIGADTALVCTETVLLGVRVPNRGVSHVLIRENFKRTVNKRESAAGKT